MKTRTILLILLTLLPCTVEAQFRVGIPLHLQWDYTDADIACLDCEGGSVVRFFVQIDSGEVIDAGLPKISEFTYQYSLPRLSVGQHTVGVQACTITTCGGAMTVTFEIVPAAPPIPRNLKLVQ